MEKIYLVKFRDQSPVYIKCSGYTYVAEGRLIDLKDDQGEKMGYLCTDVLEAFIQRDSIVPKAELPK